MTDDTLLPFDLPSVRRKKLTVDFDGGKQSSDAGLLLLREPERKPESGPLTDREIEELDAFLLAEDGLENGASASLQRPPYFRPFQYFGHTASRRMAIVFPSRPGFCDAPIFTERPERHRL
jgi:hypothetical protein